MRLADRLCLGGVDSVDQVLKVLPPQLADIVRRHPDSDPTTGLLSPTEHVEHRPELGVLRLLEHMYRPLSTTVGMQAKATGTGTAKAG